MTAIAARMSATGREAHNTVFTRKLRGEKKSARRTFHPAGAVVPFAEPFMIIAA